MSRLVRKDYDKPNRCPAWSGPGFRSYPWERKLPKCSDGSSGYYAERCVVYDEFPEILEYPREATARTRAAKRRMAAVEWHIHSCTTCGTQTLPNALRWVDPDWLRFVVCDRFWRWTVLAKMREMCLRRG